jgi:ubiquinone/menaquinone biosynthesis C-methylase UbiE
MEPKDMNPHDAKLWAQMIALAPFMFQAALSLRNLGLLKAIGEAGPEGATPGQLRERVDLHEYGVGVLLDAGESSGLLSAREGRYFLTAAGECIENDRITNINMNFSQDVCYQGLFSLEESLRRRRPEGLKVFGAWKTIYEGLTQLPARALKSWFDFDHYFSDDAFPKVLPLVFRDGPRRVLDVGGNTGKFAVACAKYDASVSVTILDHPAQLKLAAERALEAGAAERVRGQAMDLLDHSLAFPEGFDVIWMSQFLDCFGKEDILALMKRAAAAMTPSTRFFIMEPFVDRQKFEASKFCLNMTSLYFTAIANGESRFYRAADFYDLLNQAGLEVEEEYGPIRLSHTLLRCKLKS